MASPATAAESLAWKFASHHEALDNSRKELVRFKGVADACPIPVVLVSAAGENVYSNQAYASFLGCTQEDLLGLNWHKFFLPEALAAVNEKWLPFLNSSEEKLELEVNFFARNQRMPARIKVARIPDDGIVAFILPQ